ncbi:MAG: DUF1800 domain-containing protein [Saprospiraceae bacterium]|nr:DUF1800 domain-containing protein [Saprospiraceae bacterium]
MPKPTYPRSALFQKLRGTHPLVTLVSPSEADEKLKDFPETEFTLSGGLTPYAGPWTKAHAAHLLRRATFGIKKAHLDQFTAFSNAAEAVDAILSPPPLPDPPVNNYNNPDFTDPFIPLGATWVDAKPLPDNEGYRIESWRGWWLKQVVESGADIREKMTLFWYNHFPIQADIVFEGRALYRYNNLLRSNALGNFKELVKLVTIDPAMLYFLNGYLNEVDAPDENFARELQELFTIGKESTNTYTEDDVRAAARVLTGWKVNSLIGASFFDEPSHDKANKPFSSFYNNTVIAGQADGAAELDALLDMIFQKEEIATYICRKIYRFFVYYKIDQTVEDEIIAPLAQLFRDNNYDIQPVMRTLLLSAHFFDAANKGCYIKTPLDLTMGLMRNFVLDAVYPEPYDEWVIMLYLNYYNNELQMLLGQPPNVAGWPPFRQAPGYHRNWISGATMRNRNVFTDIMALYAYNGKNASIKINHIATVAQFSDPGEPNVLIDELLSILLPMEIPIQKKLVMKGILLSGQAEDHYWTDAWNAYLANPNDPMAFETVQSRLMFLHKYIMNLAEYQLI